MLFGFCVSNVRWYYKFAADGAVGRKTAKRTLTLGLKEKSKEMIFPCFTGISELRIMLGLSYQDCMDLCGVKIYRSKYFWKDAEGREFETANKRKVLIGFDVASKAATRFGFDPKLVDPEPEWTKQDLLASESVPLNQATQSQQNHSQPFRDSNSTSLVSKISKPVPVVAIVGHVNHGKTTLLDALRNSNEAANEPGGITQQSKAFTVDVSEKNSLLNSESRDESKTQYLSKTRELLQNPPSFDLSQMTFIDTPGHKVFDVTRGRSVAAADVALIVVSSENGADRQTEESLRYADEFEIPVVFAISKIDLEFCNPEFVKQDLISQIHKLTERGILKSDFKPAAENSIFISSIEKKNLDILIRQIQLELSQTISKCGNLYSLPLRLPASPSMTPGKALEQKNSLRKTDWHVGCLEKPKGMGVILDIEKSSEGTVISLVLKSGTIKLGDYFVAGTAYGKVKNIFSTDGIPRPGVAVKITGLQKASTNGSCAPDDLLMIFSQQRSHRLAAYRQRVEELNALQTSGPALELPWQIDSDLINPKTHSDKPRPKETAERALTSDNRVSSAKEITRNFSAINHPTFEGADFTDSGPTDPLTKMRNMEISRQKQKALELMERRIAEARDSTQGIFVSKTFGRKSKNQQKTAAESSEDPPDENNQDEKIPSDYIYYTQRESFQESAEMESQRVRDRWNKKQENKFLALQQEEEKRNFEKSEIARIRKDIYGGDNSGILSSTLSDSEFSGKPGDAHLDTLHERKPVLPIILKTKSYAVFNAVLDELETLEGKYNIRIPVVHGGIGNVNSDDIHHAEVEKEYGYCPVYVLSVDETPAARSAAIKGSIDIIKFQVFSQIVEHVTKRCEKLVEKAEKISRAEALRKKLPPTHSCM